MSLGFSALCYLAAWDKGRPLQGGLAFEPLLRRIRLDYSVDSLKRIDTFLDALRTAKKPQLEAMLADQPSQNLLHLLAFYVGEVIGRSLGTAPQWLTYDDVLKADPGSMPFGSAFENSVMCRFPGAQVRVETFAPLVAIASRLFDGNTSKSVHFSAGMLVPEARQRAPASQQPLPPPPPPPWSTDVNKAVARLTRSELEPLRIDPPDWAAQDPLQRFFDAAPAVLRRGRVVWAGLIQANNDLFRPQGYAGAPGEVVYDPSGRATPEGLEAVARKVSALKGQQLQDPALAAIGSYLASETDRAFALDVPDEISPWPLKISTTWFQRTYLPGERIAQATFPALISDEHPGVVLFLPARLWPAELLKAWT